ncbi:MAG: hypothetical protein Tsb0034_08480 [Ekhidna sp.]
MELVKRSILDEYYTSIKEYGDENPIHFTEQKDPITFEDFHLLNGRQVSASSVNAFIEKMIDSLRIPALSIAILNGENTVYHHNYGFKDLEDSTRVDANTLFEAASISKPFFSYAVMKLNEQEVLDLDDPLSNYYVLEDLSHDPRHELLTTRMVLTHTTGLPNWRTDSLKLEADPGKEHIYSGEGFEYLGRVISEIEQRDLNEILEQFLLEPFEMNYSTFIEDANTKFNKTTGHRNLEVSGRNISFSAHPAYGLRTNAREFANFLGAVHKTPLFQEMRTPQFEIDSLKSVGLGLFIRKTDFGLKYYHTGNNSNRFTGRFELYPDQDFGFVFFTNCEKEEEITSELLKLFSNDYLISQYPLGD